MPETVRILNQTGKVLNKMCSIIQEVNEPTYLIT